MSRDFMCALFYVLFEIDWYCYVRWEHNYQNYNRNWDEVGPLCSRTIYRLRPIWQRNPDEDGKKFKFLYKHDKMVIFWFPLYVLHRVIVNRIYVSRKINTLKKKQISAKNKYPSWLPHFWCFTLERMYIGLLVYVFKRQLCRNCVFFLRVCEKTGYLNTAGFCP